MTHEKTPTSEHEGGPEHTHNLPDADSIPVADGPFDLPPVLQPEHWDDD
jgi:hypothetical protein